MSLVLVLGCSGPDSPNTDVTTQFFADVVLEEGGVRICADPSARDAAPLNLTRGAPLDGDPVYRGHGAGALVADLDGDDRLDVMILSDDELEYYQMGSDGDLFRVASGWNDVGDGLIPLGFGVAAADYDADGDLDVMVSRYGAPNVLLNNNGDGTFVDVADMVGVAGGDEDHNSSVTWVDYDNDGDLDLMVAGHGFVDEELGDSSLFGPGHPTGFYANNGDGTFTDISDIIPYRVHQAYSFTASFLDLDGDGWKDLMMANDFGPKHTPALLAWNREGTFVLDDNAANLDQPISAMGNGIGDLNGDGQWDFLFSAWGYNAMMVSTESGRWIDYADARTVQPTLNNQTVGWGTELADMDNDADLDAVMAYGYIDTNTANNRLGQPNGLWLQEDDGSMTQVADDWGFDHPGSSRGLAVADLNDDGFMDAVVPDLGGPSLLYTSNCGDQAWIRIHLSDLGMNPDAIGAEVRVTTSDGNVQQRLIWAGGTSLGSAGPPEAHFGLADHDRITEIHVTWPDGMQTVVEDVETRQTIDIVRQP